MSCKHIEQTGYVFDMIWNADLTTAYLFTFVLPYALKIILKEIR